MPVVEFQLVRQLRSPVSKGSRLMLIEQLAYLVFRVSLRLLLGRERRNRFLARVGLTKNPLLSWRSVAPHALFKELSSHEPDVTRFVKGLRGHLFVDVGANTGYYPKLLEHNFDRTIALEADPEIYAYLEEHRPQNCNVTNVVVAESEGWVELYRNPDNLSSGASIMASYLWRGMKVRKTSLTSILQNEGNVDIVKVDVEGAEWLVLKGAESVMARIRQWVIELHDMSRKTELEEYMRRHGYRCMWLDETPTIGHAYFSR
jgi:FkbM family methyltransferase